MYYVNVLTQIYITVLNETTYNSMTDTIMYLCFEYKDVEKLVFRYCNGNVDKFSLRRKNSGSGVLARFRLLWCASEIEPVST